MSNADLNGGIADPIWKEYNKKESGGAKVYSDYGYYDGIDDAVVIKRGFDLAYEIINKIKPNDTTDKTIKACGDKETLTIKH
jgi:hypothetical protein